MYEYKATIRKIVDGDTADVDIDLGFDCWVRNCREFGLKTVGQFHDEVIVLVEDGDQDKTENLMKTSIQNLNEKLQLNVELGIDVQFGNTYAEIHYSIKYLEQFLLLGA